MWLRAGIKHQYPDYKVNQLYNVVFDFLAESPPDFEEAVNEHFRNEEEETHHLIMKAINGSYHKTLK